MTSIGARQIGLIAAGSQPWNRDVCSASNSRFAYCATLAVYVYSRNKHGDGHVLESIVAEHKKTITALSWNPHKPHLLATVGADNTAIVWNAETQKVENKTDNLRYIPQCIAWPFHMAGTLSLGGSKGPILLWNLNEESKKLSLLPYSQNFQSEITHMRWNKLNEGRLAVGHANGSLSIIDKVSKPRKHCWTPENCLDDETGIACLEWDPHSPDYLLIAHRSGAGIHLIDSNSLSPITRFELPSAAASIQCMVWVTSGPGLFLTGDAHSGVLRVWSVAKNTPIHSLKVKSTAFHSLAILPDSTRRKEEAPSLASNFALPPAQVVCCFLDGGVGVYEVARRKWSWLRDQGHVETIFDCKMAPSGEHLATASFDGTLKIWDIHSLEPITTSTGNEGIIYSVDWAPGESGYIVAGTAKNGVLVWDSIKKRLSKRFKEHRSSAVYCVAWNQIDSKMIASAGADRQCIIRNIDGSPVKIYQHPASVFGVSWSTTSRDILATGCEDSIVRIFYLTTQGDQPLKTFYGHSAKAFHVRWSPLREGIIASGSDDCTVRVWDYGEESCTNTLRGHRAPVRGLLWNTELAHILISGSWDASIRIWDIRDGSCIGEVLDHGADVYGITSHAKRPFVLASCSRDSTIRLWSLIPIVANVQLSILANRPYSEIFAPTEASLNPSGPPLLCGPLSRKIRSDLEQSNNSEPLVSFSQLFSLPGAYSNVWDLAEVLRGASLDTLSGAYSNGIIHYSHLASIKSSRAQNAEIQQGGKTSSIIAPSKEDQLKLAAEDHLRVGNINRYCEILIQLKLWDKALAVAPSVSLDYWRQLASKRADELRREEDDDFVPIATALADVSGLINYYNERGQFDRGFCIAAASHDGWIKKPISTGGSTLNGYKESEESPETFALLKTTANNLADHYLKSGQPVKAACCHLAVDDSKSAMQKLIRGNELELALCLSSYLPDVTAQRQLVIELLARKCERIAQCNCAIDLLKLLPENSDALFKFLARQAASMDEINDLHSKAGVPLIDECEIMARQCMESGRIKNAVKYFIISNNVQLGLDLGIHFIQEKIKSISWKVDEIYDIVTLLSSIRSDKLGQEILTKQRVTLQIISAYCGTLLALRRHYWNIISPLFKLVIYLMNKHTDLQIPLSLSRICSEYESWKENEDNFRLCQKFQPGGVLEDLLQRAGEESWPGGIGEDCVSGSNLPSHSDVYFSLLDSSRIQGPAFILDDGNAAMSLSDALMWAKVCEFSPLGSGLKINPF